MSFRDGAKRQTRNLEILRCATACQSSMLAHRPGMTIKRFIDRHHLLRRPLSGIMRAVGGGEKVRRGGFAGKEQPAIDGRGEHRALAGVARQRMRIGAAGEGIVRPARFRQRLQLAAKIVAEERRRSRRLPAPRSRRRRRLPVLAQTCRRKNLRCRAGRTGADDRSPSRCAWSRRAGCRRPAMLPARRAPASPCRRGRAAGRAPHRPSAGSAG